MDQSIVRSLNSWFAASGIRADLARILALAPLVAIVALVALAWLADWGRAPERRAVLVVGVLGALLALGLNVMLGHFYFRPRPFLTLSDIHALLPQQADSSLYSDHLGIAGALTAALLLARRYLGAVALGLTLLLAVGRVGAGVHYPSDVAVGALAGTVSFALLLPLRGGIANAIHAVATGERRIVDRPGKDRPFLLRHGPLVTVGIVVALVGLGYGTRALQDHFRVAQANRMESFFRHRPGERPPPEYPGTSVATIAGGRYSATHAAVLGDVTQVSRELDGDIHIRIDAVAVGEDRGLLTAQLDGHCCVG